MIRAAIIGIAASAVLVGCGQSRVDINAVSGAEGTNDGLVTVAPANLRPEPKTVDQVEHFLSHIKSYGGVEFEVYSEQPHCMGLRDESSVTKTSGEVVTTYTSFDCDYYAQSKDDVGHDFDLYVRPQSDGTWVVTGA